MSVNRQSLPVSDAVFETVVDDTALRQSPVVVVSSPRAVLTDVSRDRCLFISFQSKSLQMYNCHN